MRCMTPRDGEVELCRIEYDFEAVARRIREAGLPPVLGARLGVGR